MNQVKSISIQALDAHSARFSILQIKVMAMVIAGIVGNIFKGNISYITVSEQSICIESDEYLDDVGNKYTSKLDIDRPKNDMNNYNVTVKAICKGVVIGTEYVVFAQESEAASILEYLAI